MTDTERALRTSPADVLAEWFEMVDPNECMTWRDLAEALLAPECYGPLANPEFVMNLPGVRRP